VAIGPFEPGVQAVRQRVFHELAANATSTMSRGVFNWAERESTSEQHSTLHE
jgi:hypothetical protein